MAQRYSLTLLLLLFLTSYNSFASDEADPKPGNDMAIIAYYTGRPAQLPNSTVNKLTHIIFSFLHLQGNKLMLDDAQDSTALSYLVSLKKINPDLKVMLSLGGWGGCETCSQVFSTAAGRKEFAQSTKTILDNFQVDGIDLDWEYPTIEGYPGHQFILEDKGNFTALVKELRKTLGKKALVTFAAGGFNTFLQESVDWQTVMPLVDWVNMMSYDLVNGNSTVTGHHTPLYSTQNQVESTDNEIQFLDSIGIPLDKVVIGAAFYARVWENVENVNHGLYQSGKFKQGVPYSNMQDYIKENAGFVQYWDSVAQAPYWYNSEKKLFATHDDLRSVVRKTEYVADKKLKGIMFWELGSDKMKEGLLDAIYETKESYLPN